jgi:hypothetical protein
MGYNLLKPWETLDDWQREYIESKGNCFLLTGRQCGKSTAMSIKAGELAAQNKNQDILIVAFTEKQAYELFIKVLNYLEMRYNHLIAQGREKPTKHEIKLKNGSIVRCHACGQTGSGLRGYTLNKIFVDEAAPMSEEIFTAIMPSLAVSGGTIDISSTPRGKEGFFYKCSLREDFKKFYVSAEDCPRHDPKFLEMERKTKSNLEYAQEYLAVFLDELRRLFNDDLLKKCATIFNKEAISRNYKYYLGVDVARLGEDLSTFQILKKVDDDNILQIASIATSKQLVTQTASKIIELNDLYDFRAIGVDGSGVGAGVFDILLQESKTKGKTKSLENSTKPLDKEGKKSKKVLKEDMYMNLLALMERGKIKLLDDEELLLSLKSMQYEYVSKEGREIRFRIFGSNSHHAEGLIRAAWLVSQDKTLNIWVEYN